MVSFIIALSPEYKQFMDLCKAAAAKAAHMVASEITRKKNIKNKRSHVVNSNADDFWAEIELPELMISSGSCGWSFTSDGATWLDGDVAH
uniref:Uncharacterized protein n=1 Tax=Quercus lobata TaxID=97700 RepID=A0A7N2RE88_QUELO